MRYCAQQLQYHYVKDAQALLLELAGDAGGEHGAAEIIC
jgi:hypothetical protein